MAPASVGLWGIAAEHPGRAAVVEAGRAVLTFGELAGRSNQVLHGLLRRHRQRDRAGRPHPDDRGAVRRRHEAAGAGFDAMAPENIAPIVAWLASGESAGVSGRVFEVMGGQVGLAEGWRHGPVTRRDGALDPSELGPVVERLLAEGAEPTPLPGAG